MKQLLFALLLVACASNHTYAADRSPAINPNIYPTMQRFQELCQARAEVLAKQGHNIQHCVHFVSELGGGGTIVVGFDTERFHLHFNVRGTFMDGKRFKDYINLASPAEAQKIIREHQLVTCR